MTRDRQRLGKLGEDLACGELERRGYVIVARRYRRRGGELDIVARHGPTLVFVEVKAREGREFGEGSEAIGRRKRQRITIVALDDMARHHAVGSPCRFDVVSILWQGSEPTIEVYENAFDAAW